MRALGWPLLWALALAPEAHAATITGTVSWARPRTSTISPTKDRHVCSRVVRVPDVSVSARGGVAEAIIYLDGVPPEAAPPRVDARVDQLDCRFVPHVAAATLGSRLVLANSDALLHNVHVYDSAGRTVANYAMPVRGQETAIKLDAPGDLRLGCDAGHDWMAAHVRVFAHRYFTQSGPGGSYTLGKLAPGRYRVVAWHPDLGSIETTVVAGEGPPVRADLVFGK